MAKWRRRWDRIWEYAGEGLEGIGEVEMEMRRGLGAGRDSGAGKRLGNSREVMKKEE